MSTNAIDAAPLKEIQKFIWSQGDFTPLAAQVMPTAEALVDAAAVAAGDRVLDVAAGTGNVAVAAARRGAHVTATDITPRMLEWGRARAAAEGFDEIEWLEADAEALPFADDTFDCVLSTFGAMFAPRPAVAAAELFRVVRPGGTVGLANWTPDSMPGRTLGLVSSHMPPRPDGIPAPMDWGIEEIARARLAPLARDVRIEPREAVMEHPSLEEMGAFQNANLGPLVAAKMALGDRFDELARQMRAVLEDMNQATDGSVRVVSGYLQIVAVKPG